MGKVMVFDASSWSLTHTCHVGNARLVTRTTDTHTHCTHLKICTGIM